ncbi:endopeptidase La [Paludisphaera borealis]|uniref:Lon protease n=1 Tax=Paludisphaera borealis TaxID=1387353 RepID=A0A1U7CVZ9_9BACT|nr:endopeptidase La [Paludisphaera borealis]APW63130.1 Lon protease 2 [Paludisphaera borealis]
MRPRIKKSQASRGKQSDEAEAKVGDAPRKGAGSRRVRAASDHEAAPVLHANRLPLLPLRSDLVFPQTVVPLVINRASGIRLVDDVLVGERLVGLASQLHPEIDDPGVNDLFPTICVGTVLKMLKFPDGSTRIVCQGQTRAKLVRVVQTEPYLIGEVEPLEEVEEEGVELDALVHHVNRLFQRMVDQSQQIPEELQVAAMNTREPGRLADLLASSLPFSIEERQTLLGEVNVRIRLERLGQYLSRQLAVLELSTRIQEQVGSELSKAQRDHFLRQQIKAIQEELGEGEGENPEVAELWERIKAANPPEEVQREAERELERLVGMHPSSAEYSIVRTYLDWLAILPWAVASRDRLDLRRARKVLDTDHYDLEKIKERILEYLAVRKLKKDMKGPILCFSGPPGTGKTSLGKSIAKALGREFIRISLGGVHDEAEIRGHRRTYVAAMPGRIIQGLRKAGTNNPVFMLDEVDKLGADFRGDPSAALLEVLDPEQNSSFRDHYLDVDFDLSKVMFIATANMLETIPSPLLDRMEVLHLPGYSEEEKTLIAQKYIIPKQLEAHGLVADDLEVTDQAVRKVIADYTREAGLRNLEREIAALCRKVARRRAEGKRRSVTIGPTQVAELLGPSRFFRELVDRTGVPGVATGLAWTPTGGEILFIEATGMAGKGGLTLTGLLGDSMRESAQAAMSYLRSHAKLLLLDPSRISKTDVHIHVPAGAVPKDGPSAGVAIASALISLFRDQPITNELAMTGEVTLTGRVLPVGGVRDKILAARRAGIRTVLLPRHNEKDLVELPPEVKADLTFRLIDTLDDVVPRLFEPPSAKPRQKPEPVKPSTDPLDSVKRKKVAAPSDPKSDLPPQKPHRRSRSL